jgi:hypothetical protein
MTLEDKSCRRGVTSEITFIAPIVRGLVRDPETAGISYADRLKRVLQAFNERENEFDGTLPVPLALRAFRGIHFAHLALIDGDTRLLFSVDFDGSASDYLAGLSRDVPWLLNLVFSSCVGWESVVDRPDQLIEFVRSYQVETTFWYAHAPALSVRDIEWLDGLRRELEAGPTDCKTASELVVRLQAAATQRAAPRSIKQRIEQMFAAQEEVKSGARKQAQELFKLAFSQIFPLNEWQEAYRETFQEAVGSP